MSAAPRPKPAYFTYQEVTGSDLCQGDILSPTKPLRSLLAEVHPHFHDRKYIAFMVLTQTCDLVRRDNQQFRTRYVNLAVVRPLRDVLLTLLDRECEMAQVRGTRLSGVYAVETKVKAERLLERST